MDENTQDHQPVTPHRVTGEVTLPPVIACGALMGIPRCTPEGTEEGDPVLPHVIACGAPLGIPRCAQGVTEDEGPWGNSEDEKKRQAGAHNDDAYNKDCEYCRKAA